MRQVPKRNRKKKTAARVLEPRGVGKLYSTLKQNTNTRLNCRHAIVELRVELLLYSNCDIYLSEISRRSIETRFERNKRSCQHVYVYMIPVVPKPLRWWFRTSEYRTSWVLTIGGGGTKAQSKRCKRHAQRKSQTAVFVCACVEELVEWRAIRHHPHPHASLPERAVGGTPTQATAERDRPPVSFYVHRHPRVQGG